MYITLTKETLSIVFGHLRGVITFLLVDIAPPVQARGGVVCESGPVVSDEPIVPSVTRVSFTGSTIFSSIGMVYQPRV